MKAVVYSENGGPDVLRCIDIADPQVGTNTVLIRVSHVSIQGGDILNRRQVPPPSANHVVGYQAAGTVEAVGSAVTSVKVGDRVVGFAFAGSHAELFAVDESHAYLVPDGLDLANAAVVPIEFGTASDALFEFGHLRAGQTVLVRGAAGGVGLAAVVLAARAGAKVIAVAAAQPRVDTTIRLGAHYGIDYRSEDVVARTLDITQGRGVDLVLDMAGGEPLLGACADRGRYGAIGAASGMPGHFAMADLSSSALSVFSFIFGRYMSTPRVHDLIAALMHQAARKEVALPIIRIFPLSETAAAHAFVQEERPVGRVLLSIDG